jgi:LmbE family N-acetylglucosaminyl deacetylase
MADGKRRMLLVFAHPDDESFGMGGTIARYVAEGVDVYYYCATNGDVGTIPDEMQGKYPTVRELRLAELDAASKILGFKEVILGGFKDSGMMGSATSNDPESLWYQWNNDPAKVTGCVVETIRRIQPQVVVTFNRYGGYGHPDHIAIQRATVEAFKLAGDAEYKDVPLPAYQPQKLYYTALPAIMFRLLLLVMQLRGWDTRRLGTNSDIDFQAIIDNIEPVHTRVNIGDYLTIWDQASACHVSQGGGGTSSRFPGWIRKRFMRWQGFTRVLPAPNGARVDETDLFAGITPDHSHEVA